ncbi:MAG: putative endonuclease, partial [Actinomycetota bacterium]|nr:putative endonuclease [Actinomycetota bacterium]
MARVPARGNAAGKSVAADVNHAGVDEVATGSTARRALGRYGEGVAANHLAAGGLTVLARNWRCNEGEVDILARDGDVLVVCEVKTRRDAEFGTPFDAVTPRKAARL